MKKIEWKEQWSLGVSMIDNQHKELIAILNRMLTDSISIEDILKSFIDYTGKHFYDEELVMHEYEYNKNEIAKHKKEHRNFTNMLLEVSFKVVEVKDDKEELPIIMKKFKKFCFLWFEVHFLEVDKKLADFIKEVIDR